MSRCVSASGVYDLVGNAWEWTDSALLVDVDQWFGLAETAGFAVKEVDGLLKADPAAASAFVFEISGLHGALEVTDEGYLAVAVDHVDRDWGEALFSGYLILEALRDPPPAHGFLPIEVVGVQGADGKRWAMLRVRRDWDGTSLPDKRGCSYYATTHCTLQSRSFHHSVAAQLTVGFRCVWQPPASVRLGSDVKARL
jgi:hypothetical protein